MLRQTPDNIPFLKVTALYTRTYTSFKFALFIIKYSIFLVDYTFIVEHKYTEKKCFRTEEKKIKSTRLILKMIHFSSTFLLLLSTTTCMFQKNLWVASQETERLWAPQKNLWVASQETERLWAPSRISEETAEETTQWPSSRVSEETSEEMSEETLKEESEETPEEELEKEIPIECSRTRKRWAWSDHSCEEQDEYIEAVYRLREEGIYEDFIRVHRDVNERYHGTAEFLPWHRWFIFQFEDALRKISMNPCITLPYWDWQDSSVFDDDTFDGFIGWDNNEDECRWETLGGRCLERNMNRNFEMWRSGQIIAMITNYEQYSDDFPRNSRRNNGFRAAMVR